MGKRGREKEGKKGFRKDWLTKFGYLPPPDPVTGQLQTQEELTKAITAMQRFGGLEATGVLAHRARSFEALLGSH
ncbi:hypothetical protein IHE44_0006384 [Lamprotornis superbus]|uniref:Peptidoglycan binding-like domain-containing protein n=1 Tax=Lamprotornis superbus TaxID=245042 RepID=A0A835TQU3_9PASS|nr:hypothetical protein IHE44_0006384 [Lamprotornis superbus]